MEAANSMRLMDISGALSDVIESGYSFNEETGEIFGDSSNINQLEELLENKAEACAVVLKGKKALISGIDEEIKALQQRKKALENQKESFERYIAECLEAVGGSIETPKTKLSFRKSTVVKIIDDEAVPEEYLRTKKITTVDKNQVKNAIKNGKAVSGCVLVEKKNLQVK